MAEEFDPLDYSNLARSVVDALLDAEPEALPPAQFTGSGVYAIYYDGQLDYVEPDSLQNIPVYVGKAVPPGARRGRRVPQSAPNRSLHRRLTDHAQSIDQVENLTLESARCRYLVVVPIWITLAERFLIDHFQPLWNTVLDGFGNHNPGRGRAESARPRWDIVHPGRPWAGQLRAEETQQDVIALTRQR